MRKHDKSQDPEQMRLIPARKPGDIITRAIDTYHPSKAFAMFSGGKDSSVTLDYLWRYHRDVITGVIHVNTGINVPTTREFVGRFCDDRRLDYIELKTETDYWEWVMANGFPGPAMHGSMYVELKEDPLKAFIQTQKRDYHDSIMLLSGVRADESARRAQTARDVNKVGSSLWVAPLIDWNMHDLVRHRRYWNVPMSESSELICISGDCLCGAKARPGEIMDIETFYPKIAATIHEKEAEAKSLGLDRCKWGERRPGEKDSKTGPMCVGCSPLPLFDGTEENAA